MKVYLDDKRVPGPQWMLVRWPEEAIDLLKTGKVTEISLDHDLGDVANKPEGTPERTGYDVLLWIEEAVVTKGFKPPIMAVHSDNPAAIQKMGSAIKQINQLYEQIFKL